jgi:hypothetical protein
MGPKGPIWPNVAHGPKRVHMAHVAHGPKSAHMGLCGPWAQMSACGPMWPMDPQSPKIPKRAEKGPWAQRAHSCRMCYLVVSQVVGPMKTYSTKGETSIPPPPPPVQKTLCCCCQLCQKHWCLYGFGIIDMKTLCVSYGFLRCWWW